MKNLLKVLSAVLVLCMMIGVFAACDTEPEVTPSQAPSADESATQPANSGALDTYLLEIDGTTVSKDFTLPVKIGEHDAVWTSDSDEIKLEKREEDYLASIQFPDATKEVHLTVEAGGAKKTFTVRVNALDVYTFLDNYAFPQDKQTVTANFPLDSEYTYKDRTATIAWSVDEEYADYLAVSEDGKECVVYGSSLNPTVRIKATFTYNGESAPKNFRLTVGLPMSDLEKIDNWYNSTGLTQTLSGFVVAKGPWTNYNGTYEAILYIIDDSLQAGYYLYNEPTDMDEETYAKLEPGMHVTCTNPVNADYNGLMETSNYKGRTTIDADIEPIDITPYALDNDLLGNVPALRYRQSTLVSLTDWKVKSVNAKLAEKSPTTLLTLEKGGVTISVQITKYFYDYKHEAGDPIVEAILAKVKGIKEGDWISVEGVLGWYKAPQIALLSADGIKEGKKDTASDYPGVKVAKVIEKNAKALSDAGADRLITANKSFTLPTKEGDVQVEYKLCSNSGAVALENGTFTVTPGKAEKVHVQATYTCGDYSTVTFFYLESVAKDAKDKVQEEADKYTLEDRNAGVSEIRNVPLVYDDVTLSFDVVDEASKKLISVNNKGALTCQPVPEKTAVTLRVTATCGGESASKDVTFSILVSTFTAYDIVSKPAEGTEYKLGFDNGVVHLATGAMSGFYGVTSTKAEEGIPAYVEKSGKGYNVYVLVGSKKEKKYVNMTESGDYVNYTYDDKAITAWNIDGKGNLTTTDSAKDKVWVGTRGTFETIGAYRDSKYSMDKEDSYPLHLYTVSVDTATPADRCKAELNLITIPDSVIEDLELPSTYKKYYDVQISWSLKTSPTEQRLRGGKLVVHRSKEDEDIELVATAKCGSAKKSKTFNVKVMALASQKIVSEIYDIGIQLENRDSTAAEYECVGIISKIDTEYSKEFENVSFWMTDGNTEKNIEAYRAKGSDASKVKAGDIVTITGKVQNYNGTIEFVAGSVIKDRIPATLKTVTELYEDGKSANQDKTTVFSTYGTVDEIVNAYSDEYKTVNLFITDGKNRIECYKLGGDADKLKSIQVGDVIACYGMMTTYKDTVEFNGCTLVSVTRVVGLSDLEKATYEVNNVKIDDKNSGVVELNAKPKKYADVSFTISVEDEASKKLVSVTGNRLKLEKVEKDTTVTVKVTATCGSESVSRDVSFKILPDSLFKLTPVTEPKEKTAYKLGFDNHKQVLMVTGEMSGYYGVTTAKPDEALDAYAEKTSKGYRVYVLKGKEKKYVNCTTSVDANGVTHFNFTYDDKAATDWTLDGGFKVNTGDASVWAGSRGTFTTVGCYNESAYASTADTSYPLYLFTMEEDTSTPAERAQAELDALDVPASVTEDTKLPDLPQKYSDVELTWALKSAVEGQAVKDGNTLTVTRGDKEVEVVLVCTAKCEGEKKTKEFTVKVEAQATAAHVNDLYNAGMELDAGKFLDGQFRCTAIVESIVTAYSTQYGNISVWLTDGASNRIQAYRLSGDGAESIKAGDVITVLGKVKKYVKSDDVIIEFDQGCRLESRVEATFKTVTELYEDGKSGNQDKTTVFSTYGRVSKIVNPISGTYTTCNIFITDGKSEIECYKLGGNLDELKAIQEGDIVSCYGQMTTYKETVEFNGCTLIARTVEAVQSDDQIAEEEAKAYKLDDQYPGELELPSKPKHEGTTFSFAITDADTKKVATLDGNKLTLAPVEEATQLKLNVTATYNGVSATAECTFKLLPAPTEFTKFTPAETLEAGTEYRIGFDKNDSTYLVTGAMSGYYAVTDTDANNGVQAFVEKSGNGWNLYVLIDGAKKYVNCSVSGNFVNFVFEDEAKTVWSYDQGYFRTTATVNEKEEEVWAGTRGTFTTVGCYKESQYKAAEGQPLRAYTVTTEEVSADQIAEEEAKAYKLDDQYPGELELPSKPKHEGTTFSFAITDENTKKVATLNGNKLTLAAVEKETELKLSVTATYNGVSATADCAFKLLPAPSATLLTPAETLEAGTEYKIGFDKNNRTYLATGAMSGYYAVADTDANKAVQAFVEKSGKGWNLYVLIEGAKKYVNCSVSGNFVNFVFEDEAKTVWSYDQGYFRTTATVNETEEEVWAGTRSTFTTVGCYKESQYKAAEGQPLRAYAETADTSTPKDRAQAELDLLEIPASTTEDIALPAEPQKYSDVQLSWALKAPVEGQTIADGKLKVTRGSNDAEVVLVCTAKCGSTELTKEFKVRVDANATVETVYHLFQKGNALESGAYLDGQYECTAIVESIATAYSEKNGNISVWLVDGPPVKIEAYRLTGEGVDKIKAGDIVTVVGKVKKYVDKKGNVTIEFDTGCKLKDRKEATLKSVTELYEDGTSGNQDKTTVFSTYGKVKQVVNGISGTYTTVNVFITDGKNEIEAYKLGGDIEALKTIKVGDYLSCYGQMTTYKETVEFNGCTLVTLTGDYELSPKEVAEEEVQNYKMDSQHAGRVELTTASIYEGTRFSFEVGEESQALASVDDDAVMTLLPTDVATDITIIVTATYKGASATANVTFKLLPSVFTKVIPVEAEEIAAETSYMIGFDKNGNSYLATGKMSGYYAETDTDASVAIEAYVEASGNGWHLYVLIEGAKKYVNCSVSGNYVNFVYEDEATTVWSYDKGYFRTTATVNKKEEEVWAGTRSTFTTIGCYKESQYKAAEGQPLRAYVVTIDDSTTVERAQAELDLIELPASVSNDLDLPMQYQKYYDVELSWSLKEPVDGQSVSGGKLKVTRQKDDVDVVLICTATCGLQSATKEFTVTVEKDTGEYIFDFTKVTARQGTLTAGGISLAYNQVSTTNPSNRYGLYCQKNKNIEMTLTNLPQVSEFVLTINPNKDNLKGSVTISDGTSEASLAITASPANSAADYSVDVSKLDYTKTWTVTLVSESNSWRIPAVKIVK